MFKDAKTFASFSVADLEDAKKFYADTLGLNVTTNEMGVLDITLGSGSRLVIYPKPDHAPANFTVFNFIVDDIDAAVEELSGKGVKFEHYDSDQLKTDEKGISRMPDGPAMAWFKDPAGNILGVMKVK